MALPNSVPDREGGICLFEPHVQDCLCPQKIKDWVLFAINVTLCIHLVWLLLMSQCTGTHAIRSVLVLAIVMFLVQGAICVYF